MTKRTDNEISDFPAGGTSFQIFEKSQESVRETVQNKTVTPFAIAVLGYLQESYYWCYHNTRNVIGLIVSWS